MDVLNLDKTDYNSDDSQTEGFEFDDYKRDEQTLLLIGKYQKGELSVLQEIINLNTGLVFHIMKDFKYYINNGTITRDDLKISGIIGLIETIKKYDFSFGANFSTFAYKNILKELQISIASALGITVRAFNVTRKIKGYVNSRLKKEEDYQIDIKEISKTLDISEQIIKSVLNNNVAYQISLDAPIDSSNEKAGLLIDSISDENAMDVSLVEFNNEFSEDMLNFLDENEIKIIKYRFLGLDREEKSLQEVGDKIGITGERIRQIEERALEKLYGAFLFAKELQSKFGKYSLDYKTNSLNEVKYLVTNHKYILNYIGCLKKERSFLEGKFNENSIKFDSDILSSILKISDLVSFEKELLQKVYNFISTGKFLLNYQLDNFFNHKTCEPVKIQSDIYEDLKLLQKITINDLLLLSGNKKKIISMVLGLSEAKKSTQEIAEILGIKREKVLTIFKSTLIELRKKIDLIGPIHNEYIDTNITLEDDNLSLNNEDIIYHEYLGRELNYYNRINSILDFNGYDSYSEYENIDEIINGNKIVADNIYSNENIEAIEENNQIDGNGRFTFSLKGEDYKILEDIAKMNGKGIDDIFKQLISSIINGDIEIDNGNIVQLSNKKIENAIMDNGELTIVQKYTLDDYFMGNIPNSNTFYFVKNFLENCGVQDFMDIYRFDSTTFYQKSVKSNIKGKETLKLFKNALDRLEFDLKNKVPNFFYNWKIALDKALNSELETKYTYKMVYSESFMHMLIDKNFDERDIFISSLENQQIESIINIYDIILNNNNIGTLDNNALFFIFDKSYKSMDYSRIFTMLSLFNHRKINISNDIKDYISNKFPNLLFK